MQNYTQHYGGKRATQGEKIPGKRKLMTKTSDGAFVFKADDWTRLNRFLVLGADAPTFYSGKRKMIRSNAKVVERLIAKDGIRVIDTIVEISTGGRAPNNDPAIFALAMASVLGNVETRRHALANLHRVCRIGTMLFHFAEFREALGGGWGRGTRRAIRDWFNKKPVEKLAYQTIKYKQRDGWSMNDMLQLAHPKTDDEVRNAIYRWITYGHEADFELPEALPEQVIAAIDIHRVDKKHAIRLIQDHRLPHEVVPNELKKFPEVWEAMLADMPIGAVVRNVNKMTAVGLVGPMSEASKHICKMLGDAELMQNARLHPIALLKAQSIYRQGKGEKGKLTWQPVSQITDALDAGFYKAFKSIEPTGLNHGLFVDISGSMAFPLSIVKGMGGLTARALSGAMALVTANVEPNYEVFAFCSNHGSGGYFNGSDSVEMRLAPVTPRMRLDSAIGAINDLPAGGTDLAAPFKHALKEKIPIEVFVVYTDNETNRFNSMQPSLALEEYRQKTGINAKLIVVAMVANNISIADPTDSGMLDVEGFDANAPAVMADFSRGGFGEVVS